MQVLDLGFRLQHIFVECTLLVRLAEIMAVIIASRCAAFGEETTEAALQLINNSK